MQTTKISKGVKLQAKITCPKCGFVKEETMPIDSCQFFYECSNCHERIRPKDGDCCVFCSYADTKCPVEQEKASL